MANKFDIVIRTESHTIAETNYFFVMHAIIEAMRKHSDKKISDAHIMVFVCGVPYDLGEREWRAI